MKSLLQTICRLLSMLFGIQLISIGAGTELGFWITIISGGVIGFVIKTIAFPDHIINKACSSIATVTNSEASKSTIPVSNYGEYKKTKQTINATALTPSEEQENILLSQEAYEEDTYETKERKKTSLADIEIPKKENINIQERYIEVPNEQSAIMKYIRNFFSENALAKVGGILLFLGAMFFVGLIYMGVGGVGKLIIGLIFGLTVYAVGIYLDHKSLPVESQVCLGVGIAINYLVILAGRWYSFDGAEAIIGQTATFGFLIMNTLLAVVTGMIYRSNVILIFGFLLAYITPLLVGGTATSPFFVSSYASIVSLGALGLAYYISKKQTDTQVEAMENLSNSLMWIAFLGAITTFLMSYIGFPSYWLSQLLYISSICALTIALAWISNKDLIGFIIGTYLALITLILIGNNGLHDNTLYFIILGLFFALAVTSFLAAKKSTINEDANMLTGSIILPLITILMFLWIGSIDMIIPTLLFGIVMIATAGYLLRDTMSIATKYLLYIGGAIYTLCISVFVAVVTYGGFTNIMLSGAEIFSVLVVSFLLLLVSYRACKQDDMTNIYPIATCMHIITILPLLHGTNASMGLSIAVILLTLLSNVSLPIRNKNLNKNIIGTIVALVLSALFVGGEIYKYDIDMSGIVAGGRSITGFLYILLALIYMLPALYLIKNNNDENNDTTNNSYSYLGISLASLTLALGFIFAGNLGVLALSRVAMGAILAYIYTRISDSKIYWASLTLYAIGLWKIAMLLPIIQPQQYLQLIPLSMIFVGLMLGLNFIKDKTDDDRTFFDLIHAGGIGIIGILCYYIIPHTGMGRSTVAISTFLLLLSGIYSKFNTGIVRYIYIGALFLFAGLQGALIFDVFSRIDTVGLGHFRILQYISTLLIVLSGYIQVKSNKNLLSSVIFAIMACYLFVTSSIYLYDIFQNTFAISIYRGIIAYAVLHRGIANNLIKYRTIGLYIIGITLAKVGLFDIWYGIDSGIMRVIALMVLGGLLIYISTLYSKKYGGNMKGELELGNIWKE